MTHEHPPGFLGGMVAVVCLLAQACAPIPHRHYFAPAISGTVIDGDQSVSGAEVRLTASFTTRDVRVMTTVDGQFGVGPVRELRWFRPLLGDPIFGFRLEVKRGGRTYLGFVQSNVGHSPKNMKLACDLSSPIPPVPRLGDEATYCRLIQ
jgi:hypothetical protein